MQDAAVNKVNAAPEVLALRRAYILVRQEGRDKVPEIIRILIL